MYLAMPCVARTQRLALVVAFGGLLMACTQQPLPGVDPTPPRSSPQLPSGAPPPPSQTSGEPAPLQPVGGESAVSQTQIEEDATGWVEPATSEEQHQADLASCYAFANAQVRHDEQINDDRSSLFGSNNPAVAGNLYSYQKAIRPYGRNQRFERLFSRCMESRGYRQD